MFPHVPEASIRYDLMVSGSAEITCDKILQQGYLPPVRGELLISSLPTGSQVPMRRVSLPRKSHRGHRRR